jgi:hypothetical protein
MNRVGYERMDCGGARDRRRSRTTEEKGVDDWGSIARSTDQAVTTVGSAMSPPPDTAWQNQTQSGEWEESVE